MKIKESIIQINGFNFFTRILSEDETKPWLIVTHGIGEHSGRYDFIFDLFKDQYQIFCYDLRGHGKSAGKRSYVENFPQFREDLSSILTYLKENFKPNQYVLFGHSMGALITADFIQNYNEINNCEVSEKFYPEKVFLSSPPALASGLPALLVSSLPRKLVQKCSEAPIGFYMKTNLELSALSHDEEVCRAYDEDELINKTYHSKLLLGLLSRAKDVFSRPLNIQCDSFLSVGSSDKIVDPRAVDKFYKKHGQNISYKIFNDGRHELHNEKESIRKPYLDFLKESLS